MNTLQKTTMVFLFLCICFSTYAQGIDDTFVPEVNKKAENLKRELSAKEYGSEFQKQTDIEFTVDTFKIEEMLRLKFESDYSTNGMSQAMSEAEAEYDVLLNKYYKILLSKLNEEDKEVLKQAQRSWITFRDNERKLHVVISMPQYSGGGTMQNLFVADAYLQITKDRVIQMYYHITRFYQYGD